MSKQEPSGEVPDIDATGQGIQIGTGNNQYNAWMPKPPLDPTALSALNPHAAVARLQQVSHDELVDFFAGAAPDDVGEILEVFWLVDQSKIVAALGDISLRKARELIAKDFFEAIRDLPEAAQAIVSKAVELKWNAAGLLEIAEVGYVRKYKEGRVFWSEEFNVRTTIGVIDNYWTANGLECDVAIGDQEAAPSSPFRTVGIRQRFEISTVYSSEHGIFRVFDTECYKDQDDSEGWLGFPIGEIQDNRPCGVLQNFEGGTIYSFFTDRHQSFAIPREIVAVLPVDRKWRPISEEAVVRSLSDKGRTVVHFEGEGESGTYRTAVYWDEVTKPVMVAPQVWEYYNRLGAEKSWLGFPLTIEYGQHLRVGRQDFEEGALYSPSGSDPISVRNAVIEFISRFGHSVGYPVSEEHPMGTGGSDSIQFF